MGGGECGESPLVLHRPHGAVCRPPCVWSGDSLDLHDPEQYLWVLEVDTGIPPESDLYYH